MAKRGRRKKKARPHYQPESSPEKGFDFGEQMMVVVIPDVDFNQTLRDAGVFACAYGYQQVTGFSEWIPALTLVGENRHAFESAFEHFARWGCEEDGDVVDIYMMLGLDGTYKMWIGPELERSMYRMIPQADFYLPVISSVFWVKSFDSTNPTVRDLKQYCESSISPVVVSAAIGNPKNPDINQIKPIDGLPKLVKFELKIVEERECGDDPRFHPRKEHSKLHRSYPRDSLSPREYCVRRRQTFDLAFPVSRERVRRSGLLHRVWELPGFADVSETQVVQAAVNLMLSAELMPGDRHYSQIVEELPKKLWSHIYSRYETANGELKPVDHEATTVAHQIELDVHHVLMQHGIPTVSDKFVKLQSLFRRKGYIDD